MLVVLASVKWFNIYKCGTTHHFHAQTLIGTSSMLINNMNILSIQPMLKMHIIWRQAHRATAPN